MDGRNSNPIENTLDFAILNALRKESLDGVAIDRYIERVRVILEFTAARKGLASPGSTAAALQRLENSGWVCAAQTQAGLSPQTNYTLTAEGEKQLELEWASRQAWQALLKMECLTTRFVSF